MSIVIKYSGISWIGDIPISWEMRKISHHLNISEAEQLLQLLTPPFMKKVRYLGLILVILMIV